jgi:outer membrane protein insertion porin family
MRMAIVPCLAMVVAFRASVGAGVIWQSPFGPLRLDVAYPLVKEDFDETELVRFSIGTRF